MGRNVLERCLLLVLLCGVTVQSSANCNRFDGKVSATWDKNGREMVLTEPFSYVDPDCKRWDVPSGTRVDGASIPRAFWIIIGGPFEGTYRNASVVHDRYCDTRDRLWQDVHKMFYYAMLEGGTSITKAKVMYYAVLVGGPRWKLVYHTNHEPRAFRKEGDIDYEELEAWEITYNEVVVNSDIGSIKNTDLSLAEIEAMARNAFTGREPPDMRRID